MKESCCNYPNKNIPRVKKKNFIKINNVPLYEILLKKIIKCNFDEVYVDTDSDIIKVLH